MASALFDDIHATARFPLAATVAALSAPTDPRRHDLARRASAIAHQQGYDEATEALRARAARAH
ncbi:hypothetical protein ACNFJ7_04715 [Sphingomonas sp. HT-1]|uniref:hypothetical protein n=1 Tax=unclassified Sphingomonas TaxID=196159 RepID=UPI0002F22E1B|nr:MULTISPECIES: hypothetical protein [unclassified Sphingomonas]KTF69362.1 hypothetical protein ATB93_09435 [Sphingomonas sp. WG]